MSDQDWIIADLNKTRIAQGELLAGLREELRKLGKLVEYAERQGAKQMRERCVEQAPSQRSKQKIRALPLPGD